MEAILIGANGKDVPQHVVAEAKLVLVLVPIRLRQMVEHLAMDLGKLLKLQHATLMLALLVCFKL